MAEIHYNNDGALCNQKGNTLLTVNETIVTCKKCKTILNKTLHYEEKPIFLITGRKYDYNDLVNGVVDCLRKNDKFNQSLNLIYDVESIEDDNELFEIFEKYVQLK